MIPPVLLTPRSCEDLLKVLGSEPKDVIGPWPGVLPPKPHGLESGVGAGL